MNWEEVASMQRCFNVVELTSRVYADINSGGSGWLNDSHLGGVVFNVVD